MKSIKTLSVLLVCLLLSLSAFSNDNFRQEKDSLLNIIPALKGKNKLDAYAMLTTLLYSTEQADTLFMYFKEAIIEAEKQRDIEHESQFRYNYIIFLYNYDRRSELIKEVPGSMDFLYKNNQWDQYYFATGLLLETLLNEYRFETAMREAKKLYDMAKQQNHPSGMSVATFNIGVAYQKQKRFSDAEKYYRKTMTILDQRPIPILYDTYFVLCEVLLEQKQYTQALEMLKGMDALREQMEKQDNRIYPISRFNFYLMKGMVLLDMGELDKAETFLNLAEEQVPEIDRALVNIYFHKARIAKLRKDYPLALKLCEETYRLCNATGEYFFTSEIIKIKHNVLSKIHNSEDLISLFNQYVEIKDSVSNKEFQAQLDELRTLYEVDRHIAEKERNRNYFLFALAGCLLLLIVLAIWIYYNRQIAKKNKALVSQIKELQVQHEKAEAELLSKISLEIEDTDDDLCPEKRKDLLCIAIRDILLKEKEYRNPALTRDSLIERLGTNKELFIDAFQYCFGMSFSEYINFLRLKDGITLLEESDLSIEEISERVGFGSVRTFQRQFQSRYNMSPKNYRSAATG